MAGVALEQPIEEILRERLKVEQSKLVEICEQFDIAELGLFGSVLRDDFRAEGDDPSDVDLLIVYGPEHEATWKDWICLNDDLKALFGREVDVIEKRLLENPYRRKEILETTRMVYERNESAWRGLAVGCGASHCRDSAVHDWDVQG